MAMSMAMPDEGIANNSDFGNETGRCRGSFVRFGFHVSIKSSIAFRYSS